MRRRRARSASLVLGTVALAICGCTTTHSSVQVIPTTSPISNPQIVTDVLYSSPSPPMAIVQEGTKPRVGSSSVRLLVTSDFVHFKDITPSVSLLPQDQTSNAAIGGFSGASFPTPDDGWVVAGNADNSFGYLLHSTDGGTTWHLAIPTPLWNGSAGGAQVSFIDPTYGWLAAGNPASNTETFSRTTDGGTTWQTVFNEDVFNETLSLQMPTFASPTLGFAGFSKVGFAKSSTIPAPIKATGAFEETMNGGHTWSDVSLPIAGGGDRIFRSPVFFGSHGVEPILVMKASQVKSNGIIGSSLHGPVMVDFDTTDNVGATWSSTSVLATSAVGEASPATGFAELPAVSVATAKDWWVLSSAPSGLLTVDVTTDAGKHWKSPVERGLPTVPLAADQRGGATDPVEIVAVTSKIAVAEIYTNPAADRTPYLSLDGGAYWTRLKSLG